MLRDARAGAVLCAVWLAVAGSAYAQGAEGLVVQIGPALPWLAGAAAALVAGAGAWWVRNRHAEAQRRSVRALHALSEDIIAAADPADIAEKLSRVFPTVSRATAVNLYLYNRRTESLERVPTTADPEPMAASIANPPEGLANAAAVCFRNRTLLNVPDVRRNPLIKVGPKISLPRSALFIPVAARSEGSRHEILGVLEVQNSQRVGYFPPEDQAAAQHLANQVAASLKLQEQQAMREQLFRSEKLAAAGQLISSLAGELHAPIAAIARLAPALAAAPAGFPAQDLAELAAEARRAADIVARLVSFSGAEGAIPKPVDVNALVSALVRFREPEWRTLGLRVHSRLSPEPALVTAAEGQLERVVLNLLVHAEQRSAGSEAKTIGVHSSAIAGRAVVEIVYSPPPAAGEQGEPNPFADATPAAADAMGLAVCHSIVRSHGGEIRFVTALGVIRFELELPLAAEPVQAGLEAGVAARTLTLMLVEPDLAEQRMLLRVIAARGHRAVPVNPEEAAELAQRLRFDAVLWAVRGGGPRWGDFRERVGAAIPAFVLISDGYDPELARSLEGSGGFLLSRPADERQLDRILAEIAGRGR